jgi:adenine-specific DNA methylase
LLALLWPDPCDSLCPAKFKEEARRRLREVPGCNPGTTNEDLRHSLLRFIADFAKWDSATQRTYLEVSRALVKAAHAPEDGSAYEPPLVVDPFAGGGSIPLEALRLGCEAFASDLNPVAGLILKVMLEDIPRHGPALAEEVRHVGAEIKRQAEKELADLYPKDRDGATPIAYLWARTVRCESPNCGAEIPLVRSFWLSKKADRRRALRHQIERPKGDSPRVEFEVFEPHSEQEVPSGSVTRGKATCLCCGAVLPPERVRAQLTEQRGGADVVFDAKGRRNGGARLLAVVTRSPGETGRHYRLAAERDYDPVRNAQLQVSKLVKDWERGGAEGLCPIPNERINPIRPSPNARGLSAVTRYGIESFGDLFLARQKATLTHLLAILGRQSTDDASATVLALALSRFTDIYNALCRWESTKSQVRNLFTRQAIAMVWDFAEPSPLGAQAGDFSTTLGTMLRVMDALTLPAIGQVNLADAAEHPLPDEVAAVWFTDPPYYDAIPYADLSDFFYVWLRRTPRSATLMHDPFDSSNPLTPKARECVWNRGHSHAGKPKDKAFFEETINRAFHEGRRVLDTNGIGGVVFAHQTTEGWEAFLGGLTTAGWTVTASWPIATEMASRARARENASLATSVHLVCRPRPDDAPIGDWANVLRELPTRVSDWMERLQREGVRGADLVFACIGPALEIFSLYSKVETAEGREVKLDEYLAKVWEIVGRSALAQVLGTAEASARNGAAGAVEEDARLTALFLWTLQSTDGEDVENTVVDGPDDEDSNADEDEEDGSRGKTKGFTLVFDVVRRFAQPLGIELPRWEGRVIETKKGVVRLLPVAERAKQLFGEDGATAIATRLERDAALGIVSLQGVLFPETEAVPKVGGGRGRGRRGSIQLSGEILAAAREATTLDRVHASMLLQSSGRTNALRALVEAEQDRGPDFLRLANALSTLYPKGSEEKRLLEAMLVAMPR